ncbi:MAG: hypothetical protein KJ798_06935 [Gammaproteobacteria bacterium]|nr:hypothetical protein [Gammaproteobacteria bacterium]MBU0847857.1 hypothetical protein [Gammaproteobacteria bacterium]MBU1268152.1 hypothetical protein [Gammaproteobacteria bacterium]MBU1527925.1 hypothetical protein [Gammaproteobacteria bacterium]MBU1780106.1 hypothetical protein [Gammaproteobacteria bacterium]
MIFSTPVPYSEERLAGVRELAHDHLLFNPSSLEEANRNVDKLCELNVIQQVRLAALSPAVNAAWGRGKIDERCFGAMNSICARYR